MRPSVLSMCWRKLGKLLLVLLGGVFLLSGCARHYVMKMSNGVSIITASKPRLKGARYYYKDASGRETWVAQSRVLEIEPASMAKEEQPVFKGAPVK